MSRPYLRHFALSGPKERSANYLLRPLNVLMVKKTIQFVNNFALFGEIKVPNL